MDRFVDKTKEFKQLDKVNDAYKIMNMKKNAFETCSTTVFMRRSDKREYGDLIHDFSIQYVIKNNQYPKTLQEAVDVMHNMKFKSENNNNKSNTQKQNINGDGE